MAILMFLEVHHYWFKYFIIYFGLGQIEYLRSTFLWDYILKNHIGVQL